MDGALVVPLGLGVVVELVTTGLEVVVVAVAVEVTPGLLVVVDGIGGISVRGGRSRKTTLYHKVSFGSFWLI